MGIFSSQHIYAGKLHRAIINDDLEELKRLLDKKGDINSKPALFAFRDSNNDPPLLFACWLGKFDAALMLLDYGADPNIEKKGESALMRCHYNAKGNQEKMLSVIKKLIEKGADVNYKTSQNVSVLGHALTHLSLPNMKFSDGDICRAFRLLVDNGANFEAAYKNKSILLDSAVYRYDGFIEYLINKKNADIEAQDESFNSPLILAAKAKSKRCVELLLLRGADREHKNSVGKTAKDLAVTEGSKDIAELLSK
jgi:ankyrin repeat protein